MSYGIALFEKAKEFSLSAVNEVEARKDWRSGLPPSVPDSRTDQGEVAPLANGTEVVPVEDSTPTATSLISGGNLGESDARLMFPDCGILEMMLQGP